MAKQDLKGKTVAELREMASGRGIVAGKGWRKKDFLKALSRRKKAPVHGAQAAPLPALPPLSPGYGEDKVVSMTVSPRRIYVYWEVPEDRLEKFKGSLNLKVSDVKTDSFFYTPVSGRLGESFININPESDCTVELGVIDLRGQFVNVVQRPEALGMKAPASESSPWAALSTKEPPACEHQSGNDGPGGETALPDEFFEMPEPVSSY